MIKTIILLFSMIIFLSAASVNAQDVQGKVHTGLGIGLMSISKSTVEPATSSADDTGSTVTISSSEGIRFGTLDSSSITIGYGVSSDVVIGVGLVVGYSKFWMEISNESSDIQFSVSPTIDYMFPGKTVRVFVDASPSVSVAFSEIGNNEFSQTVFGFGATLGVRFFISESLSIDPSIGGSFWIGSGELEADGQSGEFDLSGFGGGLRIGLSGWI